MASIRFPAKLVIGSEVVEDMFPDWDEVLHENERRQPRTSVSTYQTAPQQQRVERRHIDPSAMESSLPQHVNWASRQNINTRQTVNREHGNAQQNVPMSAHIPTTSSVFNSRPVNATTSKISPTVINERPAGGNENANQNSVQQPPAPALYMTDRSSTITQTTGSNVDYSSNMLSEPANTPVNSVQSALTSAFSVLHPGYGDNIRPETQGINQQNNNIYSATVEPSQAYVQQRANGLPEQNHVTTTGDNFVIISNGQSTDPIANMIPDMISTSSVPLINNAIVTPTVTDNLNT